MSLPLLQSTLRQLSAPTLTRASQAQVLRHVFSLLEQLVNSKNINILTDALFHSNLWTATSAYDTAYAVLQSSRYLSSEKAAYWRSVLIRCCKAVETSDWHRAVFLAALLSADLREQQGPPTWYSSRGGYASHYITAINQAMSLGGCKEDIKASLLVSLSYVCTKLTSYQLRKFSDATKIGLIEGLYRSELVFSNDMSIESKQGFKEFGLLTRTVTNLIEEAPVMNPIPSLETLLQTSWQARNNQLLWSERINKTTFFSLMSIQQPLLACVLHFGSPASMGLQETSSTLSLKILRNLQGIYPDHSVFDNWNFCLNASIDMLAYSKVITTYLDSLLKESTLAQNPLLSPNKQLFSKVRDSEDLKWLLTIIEASSSTIKSPATLDRVIIHCLYQLKAVNDPSPEDSELLHSVILSLISAHTSQFRNRIPAYVEHVLAFNKDITDRQLSLIFSTLYKLSLIKTSEQDPLDIIGALKRSIENDEDDEQRRRLLSVYLDILSAIPAQYLRVNLIQADIYIRTCDQPSSFETKFVEVCTTTMDTEKAMICVEYLLKRGEPKVIIDQTARL